ncbi:N-acetylglucosamine-6-sulfatase [Actinomycetospora sp. NBRC 106375]|uniref:sulfatase family protein n=1 Tax=Actinomycetospora sp. NBRC 106375 TaxID=3032207 RepID=UPI0024A40303|nr:sulfatase [Actinomycetospora sp. NBRC 106375]GLZ46752.1 N-acetylglucosamine-6-sulfatase [Actinomycetospora sp. NBRC 106375]
MNAFPRPALVLALALALVAAAGCAGSRRADPAPGPELPGPEVPPASPPGHPNVVLVLTDDLDTSLLRFMPHAQQLAARGASFADYSVSDTLCCPSRSSIFTGQYPHDTGVFTNTSPDGGYDVFHSRGLEQQTFATSLQAAGYRTAMMGKYLNGYEPTSDGVPQGWNEWDVAGNGYREYGYDLDQNGRVTHHGDAPPDYLTDVVSARGQDFVRTHAGAGQPFFLEIATFAPHGPSTPAPPDVDAFPGLIAPRDPSFNTPDAPGAPGWLRSLAPLDHRQVDRIDAQYRKRAQSVQAVDRMLGDLQTTLAQTGQLANTVVMFSSDNGFHLGQHQLAGGKQTAFATDLTVPLIAAGPGVAPRTVPQLAQNVDLAPTIADLAHAPGLPAADGRSLVPLLAETDPPDWRTAALVEHHGPNDDPSDPDRATGRNRSNPPSYTAIETAAGTYVEYVTGEREYHDRATDPFQRTNAVAALPPDRAAALHTTLTALAACHGPVACAAAGRARS